MSRLMLTLPYSLEHVGDVLSRWTELVARRLPLSCARIGMGRP
jgi:hypothetical protein